ncbi:peptide/nickel transport system ATP-binding protein [Kribbella sp. VKM Ac-2527]|uniref:Peptide/nickel transport system ATP-binding protein n=1 Tax=Kribbella caucasensis TaxID=2512215 RepID=A0A4R6KF45_9ACTN|nr:ABC transporter ATP-binding protein [Kribbella sp. VKM Ac-2527]TDO48675.1 peptide/nickel transport system ATP-binding protein [Kribbella sp. VKM Ac-2527]
MTKTIELRGVEQRFHARGTPGGYLTAVDDASFTLAADPAQVVSLVGQSGSGKSTIARHVLGLQKPSAGSVLYGGKDIFKLSRAEYDDYRRNVQPVFQDPYAIFNPFYRVDRVLWKAVKKFGLASSRAAGLELIEESLRAVKLEPERVLGRYPHQLSGGQRQRVMLARVHMLRPAFIIADEPVSMLDAQVRKLFLNILLDFQRDHGMTTLFITHDLSTVYYLGGSVMVITKGVIVERGPVDTVMHEPSHPYTRLLLDSIPQPDPDQRWTDRIDVDEATGAEGAAPKASIPETPII